LAAIENARMEWNQARLAWSVLEEGSAVAGQATGSAAPVSLLTGLTTAQLARLGLAFNWPVALLGLGVFALAVVLALKR
jgi:hypothetical protein